jgi:hypothetical protein
VAGAEHDLLSGDGEGERKGESGKEMGWGGVAGCGGVGQETRAGDRTGRWGA